MKMWMSKSMRDVDIDARCGVQMYLVSSFLLCTLGQQCFVHLFIWIGQSVQVSVCPSVCD